MKILSPEPTTYILHEAERGEILNVPLRLKTAAASGNWRCYLNGRPLTASAHAGEDSLLKVRPGDHSLLCSDEQGRSDQVDFSVEL